jgi:hypothetical protein
MIATVKEISRKFKRMRLSPQHTSLFGVAVDTIEVSKEEIDVPLLQLFQMN